MRKKILSKFIAIVLIAGLNWLGFWVVIQAGAFFNDSETTKISSFSVASLNFSLESDNNFSPEIIPSTNAEREIRVVNESNMDLHYNIGIDIVNGNNGLCNILDLEVLRNGALLSTSSLVNFNLSNLYLGTSTVDIWNFSAVLTNNDYGYWSEACEFDFMFNGEQTGKKGFSDSEIISNIVTSGTWENVAEYLVINKVYYDVDDAHGREGKNEWIELFNPTDEDINVKKWEICNRNKCEKINTNIVIEAGAYALISRDSSTWKYWEVPDGVKTINALSGQFEMNNNADILILKDNYGNIIDQMNWGEPYQYWHNYNSDAWNPGVATTSEGHMLGRVPSGHDTDTIFDWKDLSLPEVEVISPNGGEVWWVAHTEEIYWNASSTNESADSEMAIVIYYSNDSGNTWGFLGTTTNTGYYSFRLPLFLEDFTYFVPSAKARIKIIAVGPENFMVQSIDESDKDYCPPIDYGLLTEEELAMLKKLGLYSEASENSSASGELLDLSIELAHENIVKTQDFASQDSTPENENEENIDINDIQEENSNNDDIIDENLEDVKTTDENITEDEITTVETQDFASTIGENPEEAETADENIELDENADLNEDEETVETPCTASDSAPDTESDVIISDEAETTIIVETQDFASVGEDSEEVEITDADVIEDENIELGEDAESDEEKSDDTEIIKNTEIDQNDDDEIIEEKEIQE